MPIRPQRAAVEPGIRNGIHDLLARPAQQLRRDRRRGDAHQQHVIQSDAVETIVQRQNALDLVRLDHGAQQLADGAGASALRLKI